MKRLRCGRRGAACDVRVEHVDRDVAVVVIPDAVMLTAVANATRLTAQQARVIGWALIEAADAVEAAS